MKKIIVGVALMALAYPAAALLGKEFDLRWFQEKTLFTAEKQIIELAMRHPVRHDDPVKPAGWFINTFGRFINCRLSSVSRGVTITPSFCEVRGAQFPSVDAYFNNGTAIKFPIVGLKNPQAMLGQTEIGRELWVIDVVGMLPETEAIKASVDSGGFIPKAANKAIRNPSQSCPVVMEDGATLHARIDRIGGLHEVEAAGTLDAGTDMAKGIRRLYLSNETTHQSACKLAKLVVSHNFRIIIQPRPQTHYHSGYIDHYNDVMWREARRVVGSEFEQAVWTMFK